MGVPSGGCRSPLVESVFKANQTGLISQHSAQNQWHHKPTIGGESDTYFDRGPKGLTDGRASDCVRSSASQMGQDQISFKAPYSLNDSGCSTRLCEVHLAVGKPLRPMPWSSSIIFELPPGSEVLSLYPRIAIRRATLSKRKLERSFFGWG